jgi:hypothetical protein
MPEGSKGMRGNSFNRDVADLLSISEIKENVIAVVHYLINDPIMTREAAAQKLLNVIPLFNDVEKDAYESLQMDLNRKLAMLRDVEEERILYINFVDPRLEDTIKQIQALLLDDWKVSEQEFSEVTGLRVVLRN